MIYSLIQRLASGQIVLKTLDISEVLPTVIEGFGVEIEEKKAIITTDKLCIIQGPQRQLQQLFQNLLANALKYHKSARPEVHISCRKAMGKEAP